jgi:hypothetical protein
MNLKIFLTMGEKPPDTFGRGRDASSIQVSLVITSPRFCQELQELLVLPSAILCSTVCLLIVIILYDTCFPPSADGHEITLVYFMHLLPAKTRQLTTTTAATIITDHHNNSNTTPSYTHQITTTNTAALTTNNTTTNITTTNHNSSVLVARWWF